MKDIDRGWEAVQHSESPRIHTFIATSEIHLKHKLRKCRDQVLEMISGAVKHARNYTDNVEFSCEDATRTDIDYLCTAVDVPSAREPPPLTSPTLSDTRFQRSSPT